MILPPLRPLPLRSFRSTDIWHCVSTLQPAPRLPKSRAPAKKANARRTVSSSHLLQHASRRDSFPDSETGLVTPVAASNVTVSPRKELPLGHHTLDTAIPDALAVNTVDHADSIDISQAILHDDLDLTIDDPSFSKDHHDTEAHGDVVQDVLHHLKSDLEGGLLKAQRLPPQHEFTSDQLEHQLQLDTDADRLGRIIRGPMKISRSDRIQRRTWDLLYHRAPPSSAQQTLATEPNNNRPTATLLRHQILASDGAHDLERCLRVALEDDVGRIPQDHESKTYKAATLLNQSSMHDLLLSRFAAAPGLRYEATLWSTLLQNIRAANQIPDERLLWTALNTAALAHAPEAVRNYLSALGIDVLNRGHNGRYHDPDLPVEILTDGSPQIHSKPWSKPILTIDLTSTKIVELVRNLKTGFCDGSAFVKSCRHPNAMVEILDGLSNKLSALNSPSRAATLSEWRILYPWIWILSECGAGEQIRAYWNSLWNDRISHLDRPTKAQLANFFIHMLFRAGDPTRAWALHNEIGVELSQRVGKLRDPTPEERSLYHSQQHLNKALIAHMLYAPEIKDPETRRRLAEAILKHYHTELSRIENSMGIRWRPQLGHHEHVEEQALDGAASDVVPCLEPQYHEVLQTGHRLPGFNSRPIFRKKWPAADEALGNFLSVAECEVHDTDFLAWKDLPFILRSNDELQAGVDVERTPLPASQVKKVRDYNKSAKRRAKRVKAKKEKVASQA